MIHTMRIVCVFYILLTLFLLECMCAHEIPPKIQPLQPIRARNIGKDVAEPSGLTYCENTGHLYAICDKCSFIYEIDMDGQLINKYRFDESHQDVEAVACDSVNNEIYIADEEAHRITSFVLPSNQKGSSNLTQLTSFVVNTGYRDATSGLEGLTIDTLRNTIITLNEKHPRMLLNITKNGHVTDTYFPDYSEDLSGASYDAVLDRLWIVSDISQRLFLTDITGMHVYDYWDLPMENPEGVAIDNQAGLLYVATDPSSPHGVGYVPALFTFIKPVEGSGLNYYDPENPPPYPPVDCDGCDTVWAEAQLLHVQWDRSVAQHHQSLVTRVLIFMFGIATVTLTVVLVSAYIMHQRRKNKPLTYEIETLSDDELSDDE